MKLNADCMRDILLTIESMPFGNAMHLSDLKAILPDYSEDELVYTSLKLEEAGFIICNTKNVRICYDFLVIDELTFTGHQFLEDIRDDSNWVKIKEICKKVGSASVSVIAKIAGEVIASLIRSTLPLSPGAGQTK